MILFVLLIFSNTALAGTIDMELMHTKPVCDHKDQAISTAWCTLDDIKPVLEASGMVKNINEQLDLATDPSKARLYIAYFSFTNSAVAKKLCEKAKLGIPLEVFIDQSSAVDEGTAKQIALLKSCNTDAGTNTVRVHLLGTKDPWRLHHNKFLIIDPGADSSIKINFSSGNLSTFGTSLHFDHWVTTTTTRDSNFFKTHMCVVSALQTAIDPNQDGIDEAIDDPGVYRKSLDACLKKQKTLTISQAIETEFTAPMFSPDPENKIAKTLISEIGKVKPGQSISGAIQHFLHHGIAQALVKACKRGVPVTLLMDDDVISGASEVPGVTDFFNQDLDNTCIKIRFMETNSEIFQLMHNKYLILGYRRVFAGAGHFTYAALGDNYENFYLMQNAKIHNQYQELFKFMLDASISKEQVKVKQTPPTPSNN